MDITTRPHNPLTTFSRTACHQVIRASAGTGKTHQLSSRYLRLVLDGVAVDRILATTFTRKAAGEILDRILRRLMTASLEPEECAALGTDLGWNDLTSDSCRQALARITRDLHRVRVGTLDSFFAQIARSFCLELGLPPQWTILEETRDALLRRRAVQDFLAGEETDDAAEMVHWLNKGDHRRRVGALLQETVDEAYELFQETQADGGEAWNKISLGASLAAEALDQARMQFAQLEVESSFAQPHAAAIQAVAAENWDAFLLKGLPAKLIAGRTTYRNREIPSPVVDAYRPLLEHARSQLLLKLRQKNMGAVRVLRRFDEHYRQLKQQEEAFRFNDLPRVLLGFNPASHPDRFAHRLDGRLDHLLLDEFQDTSLLQWNVVKRLADEVTLDISGARSFFSVGDVKQAIYAWRGGEAEILERLAKQLHNITCSSLTASRRSARPVIFTVNKIFGNCSRHRQLEQYETGIRQWCEQFPVHETVISHDGYACVKTARLPEQGEPPRDMVLLRAADEAARLAHEGVYPEIAVLVRRNVVVARMIDLLRQRGVRASQEGGNPLTDSAGVLLILELLQFADHPGDTAARYRVLQSPLATALKLKRDGAHPGDADRVAAELRQKLVSRGYGPVVADYAQRLFRVCSPREHARLQQLIDLAYSYQPMATLRPTDFVNHVRAKLVNDPSAAMVRVMTIHQAKGLQFDAVVVVELDNAFFEPPRFAIQLDEKTLAPSVICPYVSSSLQPALPVHLRDCFASDTNRRVRECMSLLYVALTRAKTGLYLIVNPSPAKKQAKSWAGLIKAALVGDAEMAEQATAFEAGHEPSPPIRPPALAAAAARPRTTHRQIRFAAGRAATPRDLDTTSPSSLEGGRSIRLSGLLALDDGAAAQFGTLIHTWCELIEWLDQGLPTASQLRRAAAALHLPQVDVSRARRDFQRFLGHPQVEALLLRARYAEDFASWQGRQGIPPPDARADLRFEVYREQRIAHADKTAILSGQIDRLVLHFSGDDLLSADVIDFKTDFLDTQDDKQLTARREYYAPQLAAYRRAIAGMLQLPSKHVRARLVFLHIGRIVDV